MPLPSSGPIDFSDINVELEVSASAERALGGATTRTLYEIPSGAIRLAADGYGKSNTPLAGQVEFTTPGTYSWTAPVGVSSVSVVCVGAGGYAGLSSDASSGGGGGGLGWRNNITVIPGNSYTVVVGDNPNTIGAAGGTSFFIDTSTVAGFGGRGGIQGSQAGGAGGGFVGTGGGNGGSGGNSTTSDSSSNGSEAGAGGGAGGYSGNGGAGAGVGRNFVGQAGAGGGGGGGGSPESGAAGSGGGVGIYGEGSSGAGGTNQQGGFGGSGGTNGGVNGAAAGSFGAGGNGADAGAAGRGGSGAVRIIWAGRNVLTRAFPSTNTGNV